jgi:hypothetical protein
MNYHKIVIKVFGRSKSLTKMTEYGNSKNYLVTLDDVTSSVIGVEQTYLHIHIPQFIYFHICSFVTFSILVPIHCSQILKAHSKQDSINSNRKTFDKTKEKKTKYTTATINHPLIIHLDNHESSVI